MPPRSSLRARRAHARRVLDALERVHPEARCALDYRSAFQLAVATVLSAQCTDERVNQVTPALFARYPDAAALARARTEDVEEIIRSTGFFRAKTRSLLGLARGLVERHGGEIPRDMATLVKLPGIGRKTANVVLGHAFDVNEGIAVDTHVLRLANRIGLVDVDDPIKVEALLMELIPRERWTRTTDLIIFHGRKVCDARRPACGTCPIFTLCGWESRQAWAASEPPAPARRGRTTREASPRRPASRAKRSPALGRPKTTTARRPRGGTGGGK